MRNWSKGKKCALRGKSTNETDSATSLIQRPWLFISYRANQSPIKTIVKAISSVWNTLQKPAPIPLMRINYYIYAEDKKAGSGVGKEGLLSKTLARSMYPHLTEDSRNILRSRFWRCFVRNTTDNQSSFGMTDEGLNYAKVGGVGNVYNVLIPTNSQKQI